ncbi:MAG: DUF4340 domain-containing protein [Gammaproteobacteria bacterium]|nr:DUF4340 domain-containing protein [Gammaproteobacteria bacterium]
MHSRLRLNLILFLVAVTLTVFLISTGKDNEVVPDVTLTTVEPASVTSIKIIRSKNNEIVFNRREGQWMMQVPYNLPANKFRIDTMLKMLAAHSYTQFDANDVELARFLLETPEISIQFNNARIDFGDTSPLGEQRYVLFDNTVHLINDSLYEQLQSPATFFVSPGLLPPDADIISIQLPEHQLRKTADKWTIEPAGNISADKIIELVSAWKSVEAITVRAFEAKEISGTIRVELAQGEPIEFAMVSAPPQLVLARPELNIQYHISSYDAEQLLLVTGDTESADNN